jgi:hypothetical protein
MYTKKWIWLFIAAIIAVSVFTFVIPSIASGSYVTEYNTNIHSDSEAKCISLTQDVKSNLTLAHKKMSTDLLQLLDDVFIPAGQNSETLKMQMERLRQFLPAGSVSPTGDRSVIDDLVYVYIYLKPPAGTKTIEPYVWEVTDRDEKNHLAVAWVEVKALETLASLDEVRTIRTVMPPLVRTGSVTTEGDAIHRTSDVRATYSQSGSGMKVGIISDGVDNWTSARNSGDLPTDLTVLSNTQGGDEGTAVLEIVHDMVPDADLYFHDCGSNTAAFNAAIDALVDAECDVICDDIGWITQPFFEDGTIATHLTSVLASNDIIYVSAAGNAGNKHYQGDYYPISGSTQHDFSRGGTSVYYLYLSMPAESSVRIVLQWNDQFGASGNDYDLGLHSYDIADYVAISVETQDGDDDPIEFISYTVPDGTSTGDYAIVVDKWSGVGKTLEVYIYPSNGAWVYANNINPADSIFGHAAVPDAIAVGAIAANDPGNDDIEPFSSQGPVTISYPSATKRPKPDLCGIDRVKITGAGGFGYWDGSNYRFNGTSAAAPHIAAVAAQLWGASPSATVNEVRNCLYSTAVDLGDSGNDYVYGYGRADAFDAYNCLVSTPTVTTNAATNAEETTATLNGNLVSTGGFESQVWFEYGKTAAYGSSTTKQPKSTPGTFSEGIAGLDDDTTYHFRAAASNSKGTVYGDDGTFTTDELVYTNIDVGVTSNIAIANSSDLVAYLPPEYDSVDISDAVVLNVNVTDDTPGNPADDAYTDITINVSDMNIVTCKVFKSNLGFLPEVDDVTARPTVDGEPAFSRDLVNETFTIRLYVGDPLLGVIPAAGFELELAEGYNMISIPLNDSSVINASDLAAKIGTSCTEVVRWDGTSQAYVSHIPGLPLNNFATTAGEGYFVNVNNPTSVTFEGPGWTSPSVVSLISGYNMIGVPVNDSSVTTASTLAAKIDTSCTEVVKWDSNTQSYISHIPGLPLNDFDILGGQGYFVNMVNPTEVTFEGDPWED